LQHPFDERRSAAAIRRTLSEHVSTKRISRKRYRGALIAGKTPERQPQFLPEDATNTAEVPGSVNPKGKQAYRPRSRFESKQIVSAVTR
jgi:hypothetical protein